MPTTFFKCHVVEKRSNFKLHMMFFIGSDGLSQTLRQQCAAELCVNAASYAEHTCLNVEVASCETKSTTLTFGMAVATAFVLLMNNASLDDKVRVVKDEARLVLNGGEPSLLQAAALATVIKRPIHSLCLDRVRLQCLKPRPFILLPTTI